MTPSYGDAQADCANVAQQSIVSISEEDVKYRATLFMIGFALVAMAIHFWTGWQAFVDESASRGEEALLADHLVLWARDTFENLQSEFWLLAMQFALIAGFFRFIGVRAYEEDLEDLKQRLERIETQLNAIAKDTAGERGT
jgi:hypothetical protein